MRIWNTWYEMRGGRGGEGEEKGTRTRTRGSIAKLGRGGITSKPIVSRGESQSNATNQKHTTLKGNKQWEAPKGIERG